MKAKSHKVRKNTARKLLRYTLFLSITVALMYFAFRNVKLGDLWEGMKRANYFWVAVSVLVGIISNLFRAIRWQILIEPLGYKPSVTNTYNALMVGYLTNLAVPRMGEVTRCGALNKTDSIPFNSLVGSVILERIFDLLFLLIALAAIVLVRIDFFGAFIQRTVAGWFANDHSSLLPGTVLIVAAILALLIGAMLLYIFRKKLSKLKSLLSGFWHGIKSGLKMERRLEFLSYSILIMFCYWMMSYTMLLAIPETAGLSLVDGLFICVLGSLGWAVPAQGGYGSYHMIVAQGLTLYGVAFEKGIIFATISHESQVLFMILLGFISLRFVFLRTNKSVTTKKSLAV